MTTTQTPAPGVSPLAPNPEFARPASDARIEAAAQALRANGMAAIVVRDGAAAREQVLALLPPGAEVFTAASLTLDEIGLAAAINESGQYQSVRAYFATLDRAMHGREMRKLGAGPDFAVGSVHAVTAAGQVLIASYGGSHLAPYAYGAGQVIWVVGAQKIVGSLDEGFRRIEEYSYPLEDARLRALRGTPSRIGKVLIVNHEALPGRITVVLVKEVLGF